MSVDYEVQKGTALRESVQLTPIGQMIKPLSIESWQTTKGCSASEGKFVKDSPIERPTRNVGQHAVCIQTGLPWQGISDLWLGVRTVPALSVAKKSRGASVRSRTGCGAPEPGHAYEQGDADCLIDDRV